MKKVIITVVMGLVLVSSAQAMEVKNSPWDSSVYQVKQWYKKNLKDPDSVQYIEWSPVIKMPNGSYAVRVKYRARNSFNGYVVQEDVCGLNALGNVISCVDYDLFMSAIGGN